MHLEELGMNITSMLAMMGLLWFPSSRSLQQYPWQEISRHVVIMFIDYNLFKSLPLLLIMSKFSGSITNNGGLPSLIICFFIPYLSSTCHSDMILDNLLTLLLISIRRWGWVVLHFKMSHLVFLLEAQERVPQPLRERQHPSSLGCGSLQFESPT